MACRKHSALALLVLAAGCSSEASLSHLASKETATRVIDLQTFDAFVQLVDLAGIGLVVDNGQGTLTPSRAITGAMYPGEQPPDPERHTEAFTIPTVDYDPGRLLPTLHATLTHLEKESLGVALDADAVHVGMVLNGSVHVHTAWPWPDGDVVLDQMTLDGYFAIHGALVTVTSVQANVQDHVEHCGTFGWCSALATDVMPNLNGVLQDNLKARLDQLVAKPEVETALVGFLTQLANADLPGGAQPWQVDPATVDLANQQVSFGIWR